MKKTTLICTKLLLSLIALLLAFTGCGVSEGQGEDETEELTTSWESTAEETTVAESITEEITTVDDGSVISQYGTVSAEKAMEIKQCFFEHEKLAQDGYEVSVLSFRLIGIFGDVYVMFMDGPFYYTQAVSGETVDGVYFMYPDAQSIDVYCNGEFAKLKGAFEKGWLTHEDLLVILRRYGDV